MLHITVTSNRITIPFSHGVISMPLVQDKGGDSIQLGALEVVLNNQHRSKRFSAEIVSPMRQNVVQEIEQLFPDKMRERVSARPRPLRQTIRVGQFSAMAPNLQSILKLIEQDVRTNKVPRDSFSTDTSSASSSQSQTKDGDERLFTEAKDFLRSSRQIKKTPSPTSRSHFSSEEEVFDSSMSSVETIPVSQNSLLTEENLAVQQYLLLQKERESGDCFFSLELASDAFPRTTSTTIEEQKGEEGQKEAKIGVVSATLPGASAAQACAAGQSNEPKLTLIPCSCARVVPQFCQRVDIGAVPPPILFGKETVPQQQVAVSLVPQLQKERKKSDCGCFGDTGCSIM